MSSPKPRRWPGRLAATVPVLLLCGAGGAAIWGYFAVRATFKSASAVQQIYSTMAMFSGGYLALSGEYDPAIPTRLAAPSILAFGVTIAAAGTVVVTLSTKLRNIVRALVARPDLVIIGSGSTATAIVRSCLENKQRALLITEDRTSPAARACLHVIPTVSVGSLTESGAQGISRRVLARSSNVVIATDSDATNLALRNQVSVVVAPRSGRRSVVAVVGDVRLVDAMRPRHIVELKDEDVTCPAHNIAEHICHLIDAAATGPAAIGKAATPDAPDSEATATKTFTKTRTLISGVVVEIVDAGADTDSPAQSDIAHTIQQWVTRQSWGRSLLKGAEDPENPGHYNPVVPIVVNGTPTEDDLVIRIYCGSGESHVVRRLVQDRCDTSTPRVADLTIAVADHQLTTTAVASVDGTRACTGWEWIEQEAPLVRASRSGDQALGGQVLIVDPNLVGLDSHLVTDDIRLQWARLFDQTYRFMFAGNYTINGWLPGAPLGSRTAEAEAQAVERLPESKRTRDGVAEARREARKSISDRHSSEAAVRNMIVFVNSADFCVLRHDGDTAPEPPRFDETVIAGIAKKEHQDWCKRTWRDTSPRRGLLPARSHTYYCSEGSKQQLGLYSFEQLEEISQDSSDPERAREFRVIVEYNRRIATETYPAIAAHFGYRIVPRVPASSTRISAQTAPPIAASGVVR